VRALFRQPKSAAFLGRCYLAQRPEERGSAILHDLIWRECTEEEKQAARAATASLQQVLNAAQLRDFARGHTIVLDGWVLSRTEARLYALAALSA
jgi:hypothetical protein